jgi:hypothetical protein
MFKINNNVNLSLKQLVILLIIILALFTLYYKVFLESNYISLIKHKNTIKKYKLTIDKYFQKINQQNEIINSQNLIIDQINSTIHNQPLTQIGTHTSAHNGALTPSRFNSSDNNNLEPVVPVHPNQPVPTNQPLQTQFTQGSKFQHDVITHNDDQLMSSIDDLLKVSTLNNNISNNNQLDQFWETSNNIGSNTWSNGPIATRNNFNF